MIENYRFGEMIVQGKSYNKDLKIIEGRVVSNWWRKEGHSLDPSDIEDIFNSSAKILIVGTGAYGVMKIPDRTSQIIKSKGIILEAYPTAKAVDRFNELYKKGEKVAGAFHLTC